MMAFARTTLRQFFKPLACELLLLGLLQISMFRIYREVTNRNKNLFSVQNFSHIESL